MMQKEQDKGQIIIYKTKYGIPEINVKVENETVWLTQKQIADLFNVDRSVITKHTNNIFKSKELAEKSNVQKMHIANSDKPVKFYNLDVILSVGYRVNSMQATKFRIWTTNTLRNYLIRGYVVNQKRLLQEQEKLHQLQQTISFIEGKADSYLLQGKSRELLALINEYAKTLSLLNQYDQGKIKIASSKKTSFELTYKRCKSLIIEAKAQLRKNNEADVLFGSEIGEKLQSIIGAIYQTFDNKELYNGIEEKAANLLYLTIKDHPFSDGNKRIGSLLFVYFLQENDYLYRENYEKKINDNALACLALLVAASDPRDKEIMIKLIISLLQ